MSVSIIIKTLNEEKGIAATIESALAALPGGQGEVIVADSGSSDRTVAIAETYPVKVVQIVAPAQPSCGLGPQLGYQYSQYPYICLIDGDMLLDADFIPAALVCLETRPELAGVTGHVVEMNIDNLEFKQRVQRESPEKKAGIVDRMNGGGMYRRSAIEQAGFFSNRNLHAYEEFDLGVRLRVLGWQLYRMDRRFVSHYGHSINAYLLLLRRWRAKYVRGMGEMIRAAIGKPHLRNLFADLPELRLWGLVYCWWLTMLAILIFVPDKSLAVLIDLALIAVVILAMSLKQRSIRLGCYAVTAWMFHSAGLLLGLCGRQRDPAAWIESKVLHTPDQLAETADKARR